ncbi:IclR family transcriptional regulator [Sphingobium sp.]|uniref:IclR family transcriptional regulator n=1 Tax=Sphingobium sp. TaxID=1912891 RepID=UPI003B3A83E8
MPNEDQGLTDMEPDAADMLDAPRSRAPAVARAATILRLLSAEPRGLGVSEIARRAELVPSTCLHVLRALVEEGFVNFDDHRKTYRTAAGLITLVRAALANSSFPRAVQPVLDRLVDRFPVTAVALEVDGKERMIVVAISRPGGAISLHVDVGNRFPALLSASGRCFAAQSGLDKAALRKKFDALRWDQAPTFDDWYDQVQQARIEKTAVDHGHYVRGLAIAAAALPYSPDGVHRGIALIGFEHQVTGDVLEPLRAALIDAVGEVAGLID